MAGRLRSAPQAACYFLRDVLTARQRAIRLRRGKTRAARAGLDAQDNHILTHFRPREGEAYVRQRLPDSTYR
jgi:hypothetical protein